MLSWCPQPLYLRTVPANWKNISCGWQRSGGQAVLTRMSLPNGSTCTLLPSRAGPQDTAGVRGLLPHLTGSFNESLGVRHRVAHQVLWGDFSPAPPNHGKSYVRTKKPARENPMKYSRRRTVFLRRPPEPCNSASKAGSSEDSDADQYYVYSLGGPL
ncbi:uncharacterized protein C4orf51 homolog [Desmodus rotundus]|uniref:uncharacterized protein C4orf51 homolog n=1 Tax=Desmodus rotundus TaxID=9430 RepID=UPI002380E7A3|nr:uncharacterized protein C4orf51 homolog [Desmodus rotundus]